MITTDHKMAAMHSQSLLLPYKIREEESKKRRNSRPQRVRLTCLHLTLTSPESRSAFMFELCGALSKSEVLAKESIPTQARKL